MDLVEDLYIETKVQNCNEVLFKKFVKEYKLKNPTYNSNNIPDWIYLQ